MQFCKRFLNGYFDIFFFHIIYICHYLVNTYPLVRFLNRTIIAKNSFTQLLQMVQNVVHFWLRKNSLYSIVVIFRILIMGSRLLFIDIDKLYKNLNLFVFKEEVVSTSFLFWIFHRIQFVDSWPVNEIWMKIKTNSKVWKIQLKCTYNSMDPYGMWFVIAQGTCSYQWAMTEEHML